MPTRTHAHGGNHHSPEERWEKIKRIHELQALGWSQQRISEKIDVTQATVCRWLNLPQFAVQPGNHAALRVAVAIRDQLVCCDIYNQVNRLPHSDVEGKLQLMHAPEFHAVCFYGGWAAAIAEKGGQR